MFLIRTSFLLVIAALVSSFHPVPPSINTNEFDLLVIDAGHGGRDPGAHGTDSWEKNHTIAIAKELKAMVEKRMPNVKVVLSRQDDEFIELHNRAKVAYSNQADFFVSIHCNANTNTKAYGSETYTMGVHKEGANLNMIMRENQSILLEDDHETNYGGFDPKSTESFILFELMQDAFQEESIKLATKVERNLKAKRHSRGVKQAGFLVLWKAATPSILIETAFITNVEDEKFLKSDEGRKFIAQSVCEAIEEYAKEIN